MQYYQTKDFEKSLHKAMHSGGQAQKAAIKTKAVLGNLGSPEPFKGVLSTTNHGEGRIPHCVKYDLGSGWRLITSQHGKTCGFLFIGKHDDAELWLETNRGQRFAVEDGRARIVPGIGAPIASGKAFGAAGKRLYELLPAKLADHVLDQVPRSVARKLEHLDSANTSTDITAISDAIEDPETSDLVLRVFNQLLSGNVDGATAIAKFHMGAIPELDELDESQLLEVRDGADVRRLKIGSPEYQKWLEAFEKRSEWYEWFLFLHPEQERVVVADYEGPAQLSGVSGSGKTCVAVQRALRLAEQEESRILLVTLNRSLAGLLDQLVDAAGTDDDAKARIEVTCFFELAQKLLRRFEPGNDKIYRDVTWKLNEHVDEVFREYYRQWLNVDDARVLVPLHKSMNGRGVSGEVYLREEFDWIRSAVRPEERSRYLDMDRAGRRFGITTDKRESILQGLAGWEKKMAHVGVVDYLGLTWALAQHVERITPEYTHVIADEAQDFGTTELNILRRLVDEGPNDIFLCGDVAQTILPKHRSLSEAGIPKIRRERIVQNYRNSREILTAAYQLLHNNLHEDMLDSEDLEILDPKFANFSGPAPVALLADDLEEEIAYSLGFAQTQLDAGARTVCIGFAGFSARDVAEFARQCGVTALDGAYDPKSDRLVFSDLEQTKGYEFEVLVIVQCTDRVLPPDDAPEEEAHRAASKLYVAMTRARKELVLSFHDKASPWIEAVGESIGTAAWSDVEHLLPENSKGVPKRLPEVQPSREARDALQLTGDQFLYTSYAVGLSLDAQMKLEELVDGRGRIRGGTQKRERWVDVGSLLRDVSASNQYDYKPVGPAVAEELRELFASMQGQLLAAV